MKADQNLLVTVSRRNNLKWQVFVTNKAERFIFGLREFAKPSRARTYAEALHFRWSANVEQKK
jgi:hypothetical protein